MHPVLLNAAFSETAPPNNFSLDAALLWALRNTPRKCAVDWGRKSKDSETYRYLVINKAIVLIPGLLLHCAETLLLTLHLRVAPHWVEINSIIFDLETVNLTIGPSVCLCNKPK